jgi:hypothetical protein
MTKLRLQHYVPQAYLKRFADGEERMWVFDKYTKKSFHSHVRNVASETYFYDIPAELAAIAPPGLNIDVKYVEKWFSKIEGDFNTAVQSLIDHLEQTAGSEDPVFTTVDQRDFLAFCIAQQAVRTKEFRLWTSELEEKGEQAIINMVAKMRGIAERVERQPQSDAEKQLRHIQMLLDPETARGIYECLAGHIWFIGVNNTNQLLYTSDSPIVRIEHKKQPNFSHMGYCSPGVEIALPISSKYILVICEREFHKQLQVVDGKQRNLNPNNVATYNRLQVLQSNRQVYCATQSFDLAEEVCAAHLEACTPDKDRVQVNTG